MKQRRYILLSVVAVILLFCMQTKSSALVGDVDGDGTIDGYDAVMVLRHDVGLTTLTGDSLSNADTDESGDVDGYDAVLILRCDVGLIECVFEPDAVCGNGTQETGEDCDDSNTVIESCDYGETSCTVCNNFCKSVSGATSYCGDEITDTSNNEQCDDGKGNTATACTPTYGQGCSYCDASCVSQTVQPTSYCGDGTTDTANSEECDDSNTTSGDGCSETCRNEPPIAVTLSDPTNISTDAMELSWTQSSDSDFASYKLYQSTNTTVTQGSTLVGSEITEKTTLTMTVTGLAENTTYYFRVYICDSGGLCTYSNTVSGTTKSSTVPECGPQWSNLTWTKSASPFLLNCTVQIPEGQTLTIEPGVTVKFGGSYSIEIFGALVAEGTVEENIIFTSATDGQSSNATMILFNTVANLDLSSLSYITAEWGGTGLKNESTTGTLNVSYSAFMNNSGGGGIYNDSGTLIISYSAFTNDYADSTDYGGGISNISGTVSISNSNFTDNSAGNHYGGGIYSKGGALSVTNSTFTNNSSGFGAGGIYNTGNLTVTNSTFTDNTAGGYGGGIFNNGSGSHLSLSNSIFTNNSAGYYGGGISNKGSLSVTYSTFTDNSAGKDGGAICNDAYTTMSYSTINSTSGAFQGSAFVSEHGFSTYASITYTDISGYEIGVIGFEPNEYVFNHNNIHDNSQYNFKKSGSTDITVDNNYWGTTDTSTINAKINDYYDDLNLGKVLFTPILTESVTTAGDPD